MILVGTVNFDRTETVVSTHDTIAEANTAALQLVESTVRGTRLHIFVAQGTEDEYTIEALLDIT